MINDTTTLDPFFAAWLAGFIDGEGCFHIVLMKNKGKGQAKGTILPSYTLRLVITNTNRQALEGIAQTVGYGKVQDCYPKGDGRPQSKPASQYYVSGLEAVMLARAVAPYLRIKYEQARIFSQFPFPTTPRGPVSPEMLAERERAYWAVRVLNKRGRESEIEDEKIA